MVSTSGGPIALSKISRQLQGGLIRIVLCIVSVPQNPKLRSGLCAMRPDESFYNILCVVLVNDVCQDVAASLSCLSSIRVRLTRSVVYFRDKVPFIANSGLPGYPVRTHTDGDPIFYDDDRALRSEAYCIRARRPGHQLTTLFRSGLLEAVALSREWVRSPAS